MAKILITGGTGFIGRQVITACRAAGEQIAALVLPGDPEQKNLPADIEILNGDLACPPWEKIKAFAPDSCIHCAWIATPGVYLQSPLNTDFLKWSQTLARGLMEQGTAHFVGVGSCAEYLPDPLPPYAAAKADFRRSLLKLTAENPNFSFSWARIFYPYGPGEPEKKFFRFMLKNLAEGTPFSVRTPTASKDYIHVADVGRALACLAHCRAVGDFDIAGGRPTSLRTLVEQAAALAGQDPDKLVQWGEEQDPMPLPPADLSALTALGWAPAISLNRGIADLLQDARTANQTERTKHVTQ